MYQFQWYDLQTISSSFQKTNFVINLLHYTVSFKKIINWITFLKNSKYSSNIFFNPVKKWCKFRV